jgi:predicted site-specific integrase-resolvase
MTYSSTLNISIANSLLTISEAAKFLQVRLGTLRRFTYAGLLDSYCISSLEDKRYFKEDLMDFLTDHNAYKKNL